MPIGAGHHTGTERAIIIKRTRAILTGPAPYGWGNPGSCVRQYFYRITGNDNQIPITKTKKLLKAFWFSHLRNKTKLLIRKFILIRISKSEFSQLLSIQTYSL